MNVAKKVLKVNVKRAHECPEHLSENMTCKTAAQLGMVLSRTAFSTHKACVIGKVKQCNIPKETFGEKATIFNGRVGHDLAKIKAPEELKVTISKLNWRILVDEASRFKQSKFFETKGGIIPYMCKLIFAEVKQGHPT